MAAPQSFGRPIGADSAAINHTLVTDLANHSATPERYEENRLYRECDDIGNDIGALAFE